jgi:ribosomal protein L27
VPRPPQTFGELHIAADDDKGAKLEVRISTPAATGSQVWRRHASHQAQGRANKAADGAGKRLGAKKSGGEYVVPGNILFKQRGTLWFPGDNCSMVCSGKVVQHARQG